MSKMDALRAMREARYEAAKKAGAAKPTVTKPTGAATAPKTPKAAARSAATPEVDADASAEGLCGHRNLSGRTCTREKGHAAKSHRYS